MVSLAGYWVLKGKGRGINIHFARHSTLCTLWGPALGTKIITCLCASVA
jgi:hypothetical protein